MRNAVKTAIEQLETRFADHPVNRMLHTLDGCGRISVDLDLCVENPDSGSTAVDGSLQMDFPGRKLYASGILKTEAMAADVMLYADRSEIVIGTMEDGENIAYGIRYDSFRQDIRRIPLLSIFIEEPVFEEWENKLFKVKQLLDRNYQMIRIPSFSEATRNELLWGLVLLPCKVETLEDSETSFRNCYRITYTLSPERLDGLWSGGEGTMVISFVLHGNKLTQLDIEAEREGDREKYRITCSESAAEGSLRLQMETDRHGVREEASYCVVTKIGEHQISESWEICSNFEGDQPVRQFAYTWYPQTGDMQIYTPTMERIRLHLRFTETGIHLDSQEWDAFAAAIWHEKSGFLTQKKIKGSVVLQGGDTVRVPECVYLEDWSIEELFHVLALLKSVMNIPVF